MTEALTLDTGYWLCLAFFLVAFLYSMVGFGGGSSYLAILVLAGLPYQSIPATALVCNLIVTSGCCWYFYRAGHFKLRNVLPFIVLSIPMAYVGGSISITKDFFCLLLGISLLAVAVRMFLPAERFEVTKDISWQQAWAVGLPAGALLGFLAGLVGIGGGIFLSPLLLFMRWVNVKEAAASASFFIMANSLSGLTGQMQKGTAHLEWIFPLGLAVFLGGQIGSRMGAYRIPKLRLQQLLAGLVLYVAVKLLMEAAA
ncbi:MAG: sulfite exporter TauE/SafE family protein [Desulfobacterales bacterium]|nr:sulfite exporter TauE/SafE family protein [Desulfobacterales bacterium]